MSLRNKVVIIGRFKEQAFFLCASYAGIYVCIDLFFCYFKWVYMGEALYTRGEIETEKVGYIYASVKVYEGLLFEGFDCLIYISDGNF